MLPLMIALPLLAVVALFARELMREPGGRWKNWPAFLYVPVLVGMVAIAVHSVLDRGFIPNPPVDMRRFD